MADEKMYLISRSQIVDLVDACLDKATLWVSCDCFLEIRKLLPLVCIYII